MSQESINLHTVPQDVVANNIRGYYLRKLLNGYNITTMQFQASSNIVLATRVSSGEDVEEHSDFVTAKRRVRTVRRE